MSHTSVLASATGTAALALATSGWRIVPLPPGMKAAPPSGWPELATNDIVQVRAWWTERPQANIAIATGGTFFVLDVDPRHGGDATLAALQRDYAALPTTLTARTPSGGWHLYFSGPDIGNSSGKVGAGLDIKSRGGYVLAPPSRTKAAKLQSEGQYEWIDVSQAIAKAPQWLIDLASAEAGGTQRSSSTDASIFKLRHVEGEAHADLMSALDHLSTVPEVANNALWSEIGYALLSLDEQGRDIWCEWSERAPGYELLAPERWWDSHGADSARSDYRHVFTIAQRFGWINPRSRIAQTEASPPPTADRRDFVTKSMHVMLLNRKNQYDATIENLVHVLGGQQQAIIGYDEFRGRIMIAPVGGDDWRPLTDTDMIKLRETLAREQRFAPISKELMRDALQLVAERNSFDSAISWLNGLIWDGVPRVAGFLVTHCGAINDEFTRAVSQYIWSGLAARVLDPGCQLDMVVALQSPQGKQKSTGLQAMVPTDECFTDGLVLHNDDDDFKRLIRGKLVVEIAELAGLSKADINVVKRTITRRAEEWIEKWQTLPSRYKRRCMLFATTNEEKFLPPDETGQRRWLPVEVAGLNRQLIATDRLQLWAEGATLYRQYGTLYGDAERLATSRHTQYESRDVWEADIQRWLNSPPAPTPGEMPRPAPCTRPVALNEVLAGALRLSPAMMDSKAEKRAARVMRQLGFESRDVKEEGKAVKRWVAAGRG